MKGLYLTLDLASLSLPLLFSILLRMRPWSTLKTFVTSTTIVAIGFIVWDILFTRQGVWGFNSTYLLGADLFGLPIEEWLFFFCIPYASLFIYFILQRYQPQWVLNRHVTVALAWALIGLCLFTAVLNWDKSYTVSTLLLAVVTLLLFLKFEVQKLRQFFVAFVFIFLGFFLVNGVLTGWLIPEEVVWYNNAENLGIRLNTIPIEDISYAFNMLGLNLLIYTRLLRPGKDHS